MSLAAVKGGYAVHGDGKGVTYAIQMAFKKNEDRIIYEADLEAFDVHPYAGKLHSFFAVLDGHNGSLMSEHASKKLLLNILNCLPKSKETVASPDGVLEAAIKEGFSRTEDELRSDACGCIFGPPRGGSTVCCVFVRSAPGEWGGPAPLQVVCANAGDSRAILCSLPVDAATGGIRVGSDGKLTRNSSFSPSFSQSLDGSWQSNGLADLPVIANWEPRRVSSGVANAHDAGGAGESVRLGQVPMVIEDAEMHYTPEDSMRSGSAYPEDSMRNGTIYDSDSVQGGSENSVAIGKRNYRAIKKTYSIQTPGDSPKAFKENPMFPPLNADLTKGVALSVDHAAETNADEVVRIRTAGGHVAKSKRGSMEVGPLRVFPGGYAITRSLGDFDCKYVIGEPEITIVAVPAEGGRLVIASDGLFGFVTSEVTAGIVQGYVWPEDAAIALMRHVSMSYGILDDTTIVVADVSGSSSRALASGWKMDITGYRQVDPADIKAAVNLDDLTVHAPDGHEKKQSLLYELVLGERLLEAVPSRKVGNPEGKPLSELYEVVDLLGKGHFASVRLVTERATGKRRALKSETIDSVRKEVMCNELDTLVAVSGRHPALPTVYATFQEDGCLHIVTDACMGGTLLSYVASQDEHSFTEEELRHVVTQLTEAVAYCHSINVLHRDIKPDNIIMRDPPGTPGMPRIMLVDFGSAIFCFKEKTSEEIGFHGTGYYAAPEIFEMTPYGFKSDVFSIGVTVHSIVAGLPPLRTIRAIIAQLRKGELPMMPEDVSTDLRNFIQSLVTPDPVSRPSAKAALRHPWIRAGEDPAKRDARREERIKKAQAEQPGKRTLQRRNSFIAAAKGAQMSKEYESQIATILPMLLTVRQCEELYTRAKAHAAKDSGETSDDLSVIGAKDLESLLKEVDAALAASQVAAVRIKLCQGVGEAPAADDSGLGMPLTRIAALGKGQEHQDYVQVSLAAGGATLDRAISANSSGNDSSGGKSNRSPTK